ncbi:hypothetical protein PC129_g14324 [Phytophthora cactorum]|uniref:Uncharacterized protein n=1 Tax=Phytophthora cactorum TaxID=29920 RepID=A0A8T0YUL7_9STRA|nr:hypothetical protein Pcac1_g21394 [Phytophthora cactorum]KAG2828561.1 hypothetical protein PC111_g8124 [Phytophthora cactorum]KAG2851919.1 hypothetical protein PC113_g15486 [Phytophthora cactorum]KAG2937479.1 hypothetical protein PC115_g4201 [Phytophthora cactorum]KAG2969987.1 hypothetical protein PC118_g17146 [Phytophthora cactorum]
MCWQRRLEALAGSTTSCAPTGTVSTTAHITARRCTGAEGCAVYNGPRVVSVETSVVSKPGTAPV